MNRVLLDTIKKDIQTCRNYSDRKSSQRLYGDMVAKYSQLIPNFKDNLSTNGKAAIGGQEFDYRPELTAIASKLEMYLLTECPNEYQGMEGTTTGWDRVDRSLSEMKETLSIAVNEEQFQSVGMIGRETLITVAQQVFDPQKHPTVDGVEASKTDSKRMLEAFLNTSLQERSEKVRKFAKDAVDLANQLTHDRNATHSDAEICYVAVRSVAEIIKALA